MKLIQPEERKMKPKLSTAALLVAVLAFNHNLAPAQDAPPTALPAPEEVVQAPKTGPGGGGGGGGGGVFVPGVPVDRYYLSLRYSGEPGAYGYHGSSAGPATVIQFSQPDPQGLDAMQEDLNVMSLLLQRKLEDAVGENSPAYKMGIPLLLRSGQRGIESLYLDGFGALFTVNVNFPLVPPPVNKAKENEDTTGSDDWDKARKELYGVRESRDIVNPYGSAGVPYDAEQVGALKAALLEALKNAANIRGLKSDESAIVTVFGSESVEAGRGAAGGPAGGRYTVGRRYAPHEASGATGGFGGAGNASRGMTPGAGMSGFAAASMNGRGTVLTVRVKKSDTEAFAKGKMNFDQFQQKAVINAYLGSARPGGTGSSVLGDVPSLLAPV
ncbi:MAG: hypothetical protein DME22_14040, partial [Verrucomicrobia bacterium]